MIVSSVKSEHMFRAAIINPTVFSISPEYLSYAEHNSGYTPCVSEIAEKLSV